MPLLLSNLHLVRKPRRSFELVCIEMYRILVTQYASHYFTMSRRMELIKLIFHTGGCRPAVGCKVSACNAVYTRNRLIGSTGEKAHPRSTAQVRGRRPAHSYLLPELVEPIGTSPQQASQSHRSMDSTPVLGKPRMNPVTFSKPNYSSLSGNFEEQWLRFLCSYIVSSKWKT